MISMLLGLYLVGVGVTFAVVFDSDDALESIGLSLLWPGVIGIAALGVGLGTYAIFADWLSTHLKAASRKDPPDAPLE